MSFDVEVTLSGICAFVPNADPRARDKMAVLLVNALPRRDDQGVEQEKRASDCTLLKPHFPVLIFNSENLTQTAGLPPTNAKVVWRLDRLEVRFKVESPTAFRLVGGDQTTLALEDRDVEGFDFGPRMADLSPALAQVHPDCFADGPASQELISARVMVEAGRLKTKDLDARFLFRFDLPDGGETPS
ncbi:MAG TPA: hypothetical protein VEG34_09545, partial [Thermoanaerobaculia bacterium]|nr:hypothetical protein [Thermoanaerobaculia bacterium]